MNSQNFFDFLYQTFSRFLISGLVFYLFVILIPCGLYLKTNALNIVSNTAFIILFSVIIGLLLDLSKFYSITRKIIKVKKEDLENCIVKAFHVETSYPNNSDMRSDRKANIKDVASKIHDTYVRTYHHTVYQRIKDSKIYPDILSMTYITLLLSVLLGVILLLFISLSKCLNKQGWLIIFQEVFSFPRIIIIIILNLFLIFVLVKGKNRVKYTYDKNLDYISEVMNSTYEKGKKENNEILQKFFSSCEKLRFDEEKQSWIFKE